MENFKPGLVIFVSCSRLITSEKKNSDVKPLRGKIMPQKAMMSANYNMKPIYCSTKYFFIAKCYSDKYRLKYFFLLDS